MDRDSENGPKTGSGAGKGKGREWGVGSRKQAKVLPHIHTHTCAQKKHNNNYGKQQKKTK